MEIRSSTNHIWNMKDILGQGATGAVYKGRNKRNGLEVAIKTTNHVGMMRPVEVRKREFEVLSKLKHENIVAIYASENELRSQSEIIVMELCNGGSLYNLLEHPSNTYGFSEEDCKCIIKDVVAGMEHLREQGIVHRDLKPGNIMRVFKEDNTCVYKLTDFGAARELEHSDQFISIYGTEEYLHPDLYERGVLRKHSGKTFGANVDLWSIGVTFYHIATGKLPFRPHGGRQNKETMYFITTKKESGIISGVQKTERGTIEWSDKLPDNTQLSPGFQDLLTPILAGVLESVPANMMTFDDFFCKVQDMVSRKVIVVYHAQSSSFHRIYTKQDEVFANFQERVSMESKVQAPFQKFYVNGELFNPPPNQTVSKYPSTTRKCPMILMGGEFFPADALHMRKIPTTTPLPNEWTLEGDATIAKIIANCAFSCKFSVEFYEDTINAMAATLDCFIKAQKADMLRKLSSCHKLEGTRSTVSYMTKFFCDSQEHTLSLIEGILSRLPEEINCDTEDEIKKMKEWIQAKRKSKQELGKANQSEKTLKSVVSDVVNNLGLSPLVFGFREKTSKIAFCAVISNSTSKIEDIYTRYRKDKHQRRLSVPEEQNHVYDRKKLGYLIDKVCKLTKESFQHRVMFHVELQDLLNQVTLKQEEASRQQRCLTNAAEAYEAHLHSLETTQMELQESYKRILDRIKQAMTNFASSSVDSGVLSVMPFNGTTQDNLTEQIFIEVENQINQLCDTTEKSRTSAKENTDQLKSLKSSLSDFYKLLNESGLDTVKKLQELQVHQVMKDVEEANNLINQG